MKHYLILTISILIASCSQSNLNNDDETGRKSVLVHDISLRVINKLRDEKKLQICECCGGGMEQITFLHWGFFHYGEIEMAEARELLIKTGNQFLEAFNSDERIKPYLSTHPLTPENIEVNIFLKKSDGSELEPGKLHVVSISAGTLKYRTSDGEENSLRTVYKETYEEALAAYTLGK